MRQRQLFAQLACFVCPDALTAAERAALECCLRDGGAAIAADSGAATHIVCHPQHYARFLPCRNERFVAVVRPEWVFKSFLLQALLPADRFSANPALIFSALVISAGPIDKDPRKVIDGLIAHFGGQIVESERDTVGATHVLALDEPSQPEEPPVHHHWLHLSYSETDVLRSLQTWNKWLLDRPTSLEFALPSCVVAWLGKVTGLSEQHHVTYAWIEDCVRRKTRVPESAFSNKPTDGKAKRAPSWKTRPETQIENIGLDACARVYQSTKSDPGGVELTLARRSSPERTAALQAALSGAIVLLAQHIPPVLKERISEVLRTAKAKVANVPLGDSYEDIVKKVVANASFVVCRYQAGFEYEEAVRQNKRIVSIYWVLAGHSAYDDAQTPFQEAISRPVKSFGGIPGMQGFVITLSGYSSRTTPTREDIQIAIHATGACMLPVLSRTHSTHLLCYEPKGEKFKKAQSWLFENIVSHEWLFQCLSKWELVPEDAYRCTPPKANDSLAASTDANASADASNVTNDSKRSSSVTSAAATPRSKLANARFDVDDILTELNETTPGTKPGEAGADNASTGKSGAKTQQPKDVACKLFDTPTAESKAQGKEESDGSGGNKSKKRTSIETPEKTEPPRSSKRRAAAASAKKTSPSKEEPDNEDNVGDKTELDTSPTAAAKTAKSSGKKDSAAKKASNALVQASSDALEALSGGSASKKTPAANSKRKRGQSPHEDAGADSTDSSDAAPAPQTAEQPSKSAAKSKKAKTSAPDAAKAKSEAAPAAATAPKKASTPKGSAGTAKTASTASASATKTAAAASKSGEKKSDIVFLLTGTREETAVNESLIAALGGTASQSGRKYDHSSTHIICSELKRTEKFVAGCAGGKWILKPSYLEASSAAGRFVDEEPHEWGVDEHDVELMDPRIWPQAAAFWRKARAAGQPGAFVGWRFLVHPKCVPPPEMCERIIEASEGMVVQLTKTLDLAEVAASAAIDKKPLLALVPGELPTRDPWLKKFNAEKIECINASFLIDYITKDQAKRPKPESYRV